MQPKGDRLEKLTENAKEVLANSYNLAREFGNDKVTLEHVFIALLLVNKGLAARFLRSIGIDIQKTVESIRSKLKKAHSGAITEIMISDEVKDIIKTAFLLSHEFGHVYVGTEHLLLAFLKNEKLNFVKELKTAGLTFKSMKSKLFEYATYAPGALVRSGKEKEKKTEAIDYFGRNLNELEKKGRLMPIVGRNKEIERLIRILSRHTKNNPIIVGEAGVGKTAIVEGLVQRIEEGSVPESMKNLEIYQIDIASIIAGSKVRGDLEQRLLVLLSEVASSPNKILFIDEIHMIVGAGATGPDRSMDIANMLKPRLTDGSIKVIGATTIDEYRRNFEEDSALSRRFQPIMVEEISVKDAIEILKGIKPRFEEYHGVKITTEAIKDAAQLSHRYITDRYLPDKAIDVLDEAAASRKLQKEKSGKGFSEMKAKFLDLQQRKDKALKKQQFEKALVIKKEQAQVASSMKKEDKKRKKDSKSDKYSVTSEDIKKVVSEWTGIPVTTLTAGELKSLKGLARRIRNRIIGQQDAVRRVASNLKRARLGISEETRPLASFLFLGPTGVGKTEFAKVIAKQYFGSEDALIQVDMSEYMEQHSVAKIIGAPPGYVGYQEGGHLTEKVRKRPYSVVLFDEIEKAHSELLNILLQVLEEGHIQDSKGRKVNFKNTIVIMTSNIGAEDISKDKVLGFKVESEDRKDNLNAAYEKMRERLMEDLKKRLRPEFLNRIDDIVIFRGLDEDDAVKICKLLLKDVKRRLAEKGISIEVADKGVKLIAKKGFSVEYGARNIKRKIQEMIENKVSDIILENKKKPSKIKVVVEKNKLKFIPS